MRHARAPIYAFIYCMIYAVLCSFSAREAPAVLFIDGHGGYIEVKQHIMLGLSLSSPLESLENVFVSCSLAGTQA